MMKSIGYILAIFIVCSLAFQCMNKEVLEDFNQSLLECHQKTVWDSTSTAKALIGKWRWKQTVCPRTKDGVSTDDTSNIGLEFQVNSNGTLTELFNNVNVYIENNVVEVCICDSYIPDTLLYSLCYIY